MLDQERCCCAGLVDLCSRLPTTAVLLVLDDVEADHVKRLIDVTALAPGSLVIVTSRLRDVLAQTGCDPIVDVETLNPSAAMELFMLHVRRTDPKQQVPTDIDRALLAEAVGICGGLPLSLKVRSLARRR